MIDTDDVQVDETSFVPNPVGPSSRSCCRVINGNSCGSGSICGKRDNKTLCITNAHVAGVTIGKIVQCEFPFANNLKVSGRVIMAAYSDRVLMDWSVVEIDRDIPLPAVKLSIEVPGKNLYTAGYPKCQGPKFQKLTTTQITHSGTVWRGLPASIGGQSGSAIHSVDDHLQRVLLTWLWASECAGQTTRSIWFQYKNQAAVGFERPDGLIELNNRCDGLENGFFAEASITDLPIWDHTTPTPQPPTPPNDKEFRDLVLEHAEALVALAKSKPSVGSGSTEPDEGGGTFGL